MSFVSKLWKNRESEYPTRRILTDTTSGTTQTVTVERNEGNVTEAGDTFDANTMNNLESRIASAFTQADAKMGDLADLETVDKSSLVNAINEAAQGGGGGGSSTLAGLTDTSINAPTNGQVLKYDNLIEKWVNANESGGGSTVHMAIINIETDEMPLDVTAYPYTYINTVDENGTTISDADIWTYIDNGYEPVLRITSTFYVTKEVIVPMTSYDKDMKLIRFNPSPYDGTSIYWADYQLIEVGEGVNNTVNVYFSYDKYARLSSPAFTGTPTAPTPTAGDDSTKIATTAFVQNELDDINSNFSYDNQESVSVPNRTNQWTNIDSFSLTAGTWLVLATINYTANTSGYRCGLISSTSNASGADYRGSVIVAASPADVTRIQVMAILTPSSTTTFYVEGKQNSGEALTASARVQRIKLK